MSSRSRSESAGAEMPPPWRFKPLRSESSPPTRTRVSTLVVPTALDVEHDLPVVEQQRVAGLHVARQVLVGDTDVTDRAGLGIELGIEREGRALEQHDPTFTEALDADLRAAEIEQDADAAIGALRGGAHQRQAAAAVVDGAVRGIEPHDVDAGVHHLRQHLEIIGRRPDRGDDLGAPQRRWRTLIRHAHALRASATAGSVLPSTNSRNAPPPVEM